MPSDWFLLGLLGSGAGAAATGLGSAATGLGATGVGSALTSAGTGLSAASAPLLSGAGGAGAAGGAATLPSVLGSGGSGGMSGPPPLANPTTTSPPSVADLTTIPGVPPAYNYQPPGAGYLGQPAPGGTPSFMSNPASGSTSFLSSILPTSDQLRQGGLSLLAGGGGDFGQGSFMSQIGNALKARVVNQIAGQNQQMDPQTAAIIRALMQQRGLG